MRNESNREIDHLDERRKPPDPVITARKPDPRYFVAEFRLYRHF